MKKLKLLAAVSGALIVLQLIPAAVRITDWIKFKVVNAAAIGIIGSADGPTQIIVSDGFPFLNAVRIVCFAACIVTCVVSVVLLLTKKLL